MQAEKLKQQKRVPPAIKRIVEARVYLPDHLECEWEAFWELNLHRQVGMAICPLQMVDIEAYARMHAYRPSEELEDLSFCITVLDQEYLAIQREQLEQKHKADADKERLKRMPPVPAERTMRVQ